MSTTVRHLRLVASQSEPSPGVDEKTEAFAGWARREIEQQISRYDEDGRIPWGAECKQCGDGWAADDVPIPFCHSCSLCMDCDKCQADEPTCTNPFHREGDCPRCDEDKASERLSIVWMLAWKYTPDVLREAAHVAEVRGPHPF